VSAWLLAARLKTLPAAVAPVVVGAAVAHSLGGLAIVPVLLAAAGAVWIQIGTNFANDVFDYEKGADTEERLGPTRAVQAGLLSPAQMKLGMIIAFAVAVACGAALTVIAGWPIVVIGLLSVVSGIAYTGGPFPLGYNGLGDLFVFVFFGLVAVLGTVYVQMLALPWLGWMCAIPVGALATAILVVNNLRDRRTDAKVGKRTLAVRWGQLGARVEYLALMVVSYAIPIALALTLDSLWLLAPLLSLPLAIAVTVRVLRDDGPILNRALALTALVLLAHSVATALGLFMVS
jgi:1,4-dihydroxy-2-naphthoate octaprenyltransferase